MQFNSIEYIVFLLIICLVYFCLPELIKKYWLLVVSYYFYMCWNAEYSLLMLTATAVSYVSGLFIARSSSFGRKIALTAGIAVNFGILFFFKYYNFTAELLQGFFNLLPGSGINMPVLNLLLPVGISFFTFQTVGYIIDVYRDSIKPEKDFFVYALFISFFPQLVAGPIERAGNLLHQLRSKIKFDFERLRRGLLYIAAGLLKKMIIADRLAVIVNAVYNYPYNGNNGLTFIIATVCFAFQIYCDFSAYSDIARGSACILGFDLMVNFDKPYFSKSIREFWQRWHISLSTWFKDYLYFPLGGNKKGSKRSILNLFIVFFVSGLWHGAGLTFIVWGILNWLFQVIERLLWPFKKRDFGIFSVLLTFGLCCFAWIFFRANSISDALYVCKSILNFSGWSLPSSAVLTQWLDSKEYIVAFVGLACLLISEKLSFRISFAEALKNRPLVLRWAIYLLIVFSILIFGVYGGSYEPQTFLYFQF